ncbi:histidinol-phosphatase [Mesorhizobium marinum]|uniref:Histidinol-phosphatase n=1 Tax=Mesorhizobium marinum TaxID=3228790 RepID=A0ABV3R3Z7_9HYPH
MNSPDRFESVAMEMLRAARALALKHFRTRLEVERKADHSPVTLADRAVERAMKEVLAQHLPDHGVFGEEHGAAGLDARYVWVIDPIDGTKSFISGVPLFGTLIALLDGGKPVLGVIDMPALKETWVGHVGGDTSHNGHRCRTSGQQRLENTILFATSPDQFSQEETRTFEALSKACMARRFGGDCYSYGLLASGHVDLIIEAELQPYDYLPVVPVVKAAGGVITDWEGRELTLHSSGQVLAAATPELHRAALDRIAMAVA